MKTLLILAGFMFPILSFSQRLHLNLFGGFSNYQGDLQDKAITLGQSNGGFGAGLKYDLTPHFSLRSGFMTGKISADDKRSQADFLRARNLSFQSSIFEGNLMAEYNLFDINIRKFTPYAFAGVAIFHYNPYARDTVGNKIFLKPLSTEGQGLSAYPNSKAYKLTQFAIPFGGGIKMRLNENMVIGYEIGLRKLYTDYLDDVSTTYVDQSILLAERGSKAVEMAYRGDELKTGNADYPAAGTIRGGAKQKDMYYFHGITLSISLGRNGAGWGRGGNRLGCPTKVL